MSRLMIMWMLLVAFSCLHAGAGTATPPAAVERLLRRAQVHYDASVTASIYLGTAGDSKGKVIRWDDLTGNGRNLAPNACDGKVVYGSLSKIGGRPVYDLGAAGSCIDLKMASPLTTTRSVVMVAEIAAALADAEHAGYAKIRASHLAAWRRLYDRVELQLEGKPGLAHLPTRVRLARQPAEKDPAFAKLVFDHGRYLLIAANRPDRSGEATNLQGLWNDQINPPWQCDLTVNINTQMNYWPAEVCGLGECHLPLMRLLDEIAVSGARTARTLYGAGGWMAHHNIDLWRGTCPFDSVRWGGWQAGGAWLATHIWEHYRYCGDRDFLRQKVFDFA